MGRRRDLGVTAGGGAGQGRLDRPGGVHGEHRLHHRPRTSTRLELEKGGRRKDDRYEAIAKPAGARTVTRRADHQTAPARRDPRTALTLHLTAGNIVDCAAFEAVMAKFRLRRPAWKGVMPKHRKARSAEGAFAWRASRVPSFSCEHGPFSVKPIQELLSVGTARCAELWSATEAGRNMQTRERFIPNRRNA